MLEKKEKKVCYSVWPVDENWRTTEKSFDNETDMLLDKYYNHLKKYNLWFWNDKKKKEVYCYYHVSKWKTKLQVFLKAEGFLSKCIKKKPFVCSRPPNIYPSTI